MSVLKRPQAGGGLGWFGTICFGQLLSQIGTVMTSLSLGFWAFATTGRATELGFVIFFTYFPRMILGPFVGLLVDRRSRKRVLIVCDLLAALGTIALLVLFMTGSLRTWHLYVLTFTTSLFSAFQYPSFVAVATTMLSKRQYVRSGGMLTLLGTGAGFAGPILAGLLYPVVGLKGVLLVDLATFVFAAGTLVVLGISEDEPVVRPSESRVLRVRQDLIEGLRFMRTHRSILWYQLSFGIANVFGIMYTTLIRPMVLLRTGGNERMLALVLTLAGIGGIAGSVVVTVWGGARRKHSMVYAGFASGFLVQALSGLNLSVVLWAAFSFVYAFAFSIAGAHDVAIRQTKIPPRLQGRVLSIMNSIAGIPMLASTALAGPLADHVFEPAMQSGGSLVRIFGGWWEPTPEAARA